MYLLCKNIGEVTEAICANCLVILFFSFCTNVSLFFALLGGLNESKMTIPLEGVETAFVTETNDVGEVKEGIIGVQEEEEDDRTEAPQACKEEDKLRGHDTVCTVM